MPTPKKTTTKADTAAAANLIVDGENLKVGNQTLPINSIRTQFVPTIEQTIINNVEELETLALGINQNLPTLLIGDTGTGKTSLVRYLAKHTNNSFRRLNLNGGTTNDELKGHYILEENPKGGSSMKWIDGVLTDAMRNGYWIVLDEINACLPEITFTLHSLLDDDGFLVLDEKDGEVVKPHGNFRVFATMNPSFDYAGTKDLNKALLSRFPIVIQTKYQTPEIELEIIKAHNPKISDADGVAMIKVADAIRQARNSQTINFICSTRELINWAKLMKNMPIRKAFELAVLNKCDFQVDKTTIEDIGQLHLGKINQKPIMSFADFDKVLKEKDAEKEQEIKKWKDAYESIQSNLDSYKQAYNEKDKELYAQMRETNKLQAEVVKLQNKLSLAKASRK